MKSDGENFFLIELALFSIKLGNLIQLSTQIIKSASTDAQQVHSRTKFLGTPHIFQDESKGINFFTSEPSPFPEGATQRIF